MPTAMVLLPRFGTRYDFLQVVGELLARRGCHSCVSAVVVELLFDYGDGQAGLG